ncbi:MAG: CBS domain-containing protein [Desulfobacteraceae bacterium]|nr:MAG: CBS domain-containing protein [Desulfobacteraceae bacterium]
MDTDTGCELLLRIDPFSRLVPEDIKSVAHRLEMVSFEPGRFVFRQDDPSQDALLVIVSGLVELLVTSERGEEAIVGYRKSGEFFGETVVLSGQSYPGSARAKEPLTCIRVGRDVVEELIRTHPDFSEFFTTLLAERMRRLYETIQSEQNDLFVGKHELPLFNKRVGEIMAHPVNCCRMTDQVSDVSLDMAHKGVGSSVVVNNTGRPVGILSRKNIVYHLVARQSHPVGDCRASQVMNDNFETIAPEAFVGQALAILTRQRQKYLLVIRDEKPAGMLTAKDFIKSRNMGNLTLLQDIRSHRTLDELAGVSGEVDGVLNALLIEGAGTSDTLEVMSGLLERLTRAVIRISEKQMADKGLGPPPVAYCWINMGSAARHEQTLRTDQDNGIIYADPDPKEHRAPGQIKAWFQTFADMVVQGLARCGFELCTGDVMASNPLWCRSVSQWKACINQWGGSFDPEDTRNMTIFLDFRPVWGNQSLADEVRETVFKILSQAEVSNHMLTRDDVTHEKPIGFMGHIRTEKSGPNKDQLNLKTHGLVHLINGIRIYAVNQEIKEVSTLGRLEALTRQGTFDKDTAEILRTGFETLMMFRIRTNVEKLAAGEVPDNYVHPGSMSRKQRELLKDALLAVGHMQKMITRDFNRAWIGFFSG